jgi:hypothetical protein
MSQAQLELGHCSKELLVQPFALGRLGRNRLGVCAGVGLARADGAGCRTPRLTQRPWLIVRVGPLLVWVWPLRAVGMLGRLVERVVWRRSLAVEIAPPVAESRPPAKPAFPSALHV